MSPTSPHLVRLESVGLLTHNTEQKIVDIETGERELPVGEDGEIIVRGPQVMLGYWKAPEETARALRNGWLYTGDKRAVKAALLAAYDGVLRIQAGKLLTEPDPRGGEDAIAHLLGELAAKSSMLAPEMTGVLLAAALRAALTQALQGCAEARVALEGLLVASRYLLSDLPEFLFAYIFRLV